MSQFPHVGLVGQPNVGKSTLFNRLIGRRHAVVADQAGTTRDRLENVVDSGDRQFILFDMAGIELQLAKKSELSSAVQAAVLRAMDQADVLVWVVDARLGVGPHDAQVAQLLRRQGKPVIVAANQCDDPKHDIAAYEFASFGFEPVVPLSALHGRNIGELLTAVVACLPDMTDQVDVEETAKELRIALAGRPNVGKSTLLNSLVGESRSVVSATAGTTRDAVDTVLPADHLFGTQGTKWHSIRLIDTAGIRRRGKIGHEVEAWSVLRTLDSVDLAEVVLFLIDGTEGLVHQDLQVIQRIVDAGKALVLLVNKWDTILELEEVTQGTEEEGVLQDRYLNTLRQQAPFLYWVQVVFTSAQTGLNLDVLGKVVERAYQSWSLVIPQAELDELTEQLRRMPRLKNLQRIVLTHSCPPVFHLEVEGKRLPHFSTHRYVENALRERFEIGSTPIKIWSNPSVRQNHS